MGVSIIIRYKVNFFMAEDKKELDEDKERIGGVEIGAFTFSYVRSSGPGGQNVNKRSTKAVMRVDLVVVRDTVGVGVCKRLVKLASSAYISASDELQIACQSSRSQLSNKLNCIEMFESMMEKAVVKPVRRKKKKVSKRAKQKRLDEKSKRSQTKRMRSKYDSD